MYLTEFDTLTTLFENTSVCYCKTIEMDGLQKNDFNSERVTLPHKNGQYLRPH